MRQFDFEQYSDEWWAIRRGIPTASAFNKLITPGGKPSIQSKQYAYELVAECVVHEEEENFESSKWMERGVILEDEARDWFSMKQGCEVQQVGFIMNDAETAGCSPDGLLTDDCGLEIKCPKGSTHVSYLVNGKLPETYAAQVHGSLIVSGFSKWIFCSYHPSFVPFVIEVTPNEYTDKLRIALDQFIANLAELKRRILT
jgi:putative phage-type endonuclease